MIYTLLWCTVFNSDNVLLHGLVNSDLYVQFHLSGGRRTILYNL